MIRVFDFKIEGSSESVKVASMSEKMAKDFVAGTKEMLEHKESIAVEKWQEKRAGVIVEAINRALATGEPKWIPVNLQDEFDMPTLDQLYLFILEKSGLRPAGLTEGEATAASTLAKSKAA